MKAAHSKRQRRGWERRPRNHYDTTEKMTSNLPKWSTWAPTVVIFHRKTANSKQKRGRGEGWPLCHCDKTEKMTSNLPKWSTWGPTGTFFHRKAGNSTGRGWEETKKPLSHNRTNCHRFYKMNNMESMCGNFQQENCKQQRVESMVKPKDQSICWCKLTKMCCIAKHAITKKKHNIGSPKTVIATHQT